MPGKIEWDRWPCRYCGRMIDPDRNLLYRCDDANPCRGRKAARAILVEAWRRDVVEVIEGRML